MIYSKITFVVAAFSLFVTQVVSANQTEYDKVSRPPFVETNSSFECDLRRITKFSAKQDSSITFGETPASFQKNYNNSFTRLIKKPAIERTCCGEANTKAWESKFIRKPGGHVTVYSPDSTNFVVEAEPIAGISPGKKLDRQLFASIFEPSKGYSSSPDFIQIVKLPSLFEYQGKSYEYSFRYQSKTYYLPFNPLDEAVNGVNRVLVETRLAYSDIDWLFEINCKL